MRSRHPILAVVALLGAALLVTGCERPPVSSTQSGYRGTGMVQVENPRTAAKTAAARVEAPTLPPPGPTDGPKARDVYQNVKVLGDLSVGEFTRHMLAITAWVSPEQGCNYCHGANLADDSKYQKVVSRRMIEMTQHLNADWTKHVGATGVTCYTCHRGKPVPANIHFDAAAPKNNRPGSGLGNDFGQNKAIPSIAMASLPYDPFALLKNNDAIRVQTTHPLPMDNPALTKQAEVTYSLMNHMSTSLGVNCTFCHNTQSFQNWDHATPQRVTAWHGLRMTGDVNGAYLEPLTKTFPAERLGPTGDVAKVNCGTCHQGQNKPLGGAAMAKDWSGLLKVAAVAPAAMAAAPAAAAAPAPAAAPAAAAAPAPAAAAAPAPAPAAAPAPAQVAAAPAAVPAPVPAAPPPAANLDPVTAIAYFAVGSPALAAAQAKQLDEAIAALKARAGSTATISGYHSATGSLKVNQDLAKQRALKVRDKLVAAGVDASRIKLEKPQQVQGNVKGEAQEARRVEVTVR